MYKIQVFITDAYRNKVKSSHGEIFDRQPFCVPLTFSWQRLIENKELYLPNDVLTLQCEVIFPKGRKISEELEKVGDMAYDYDCKDIQAAITYATNTNSSSEEQHTKSLPTLTDDLISLFNEDILYDIKLKTATETFPAHTVVLSARSPVFKSMFLTDMREKTNKCVDIEDLDADTVRQMLLFMYKDTLDNLDYESAKSLYFAADKYNIVSLKQKCSNFLKQNLLYSNCCDILLLADKHQDLELKKTAQDCIAKNDEAVFSSDEWKNLEENHPRLTIDILRTLYMKNKKT
ncbi:TD and POZ domain-containing protein 1 [Araneus ventricosus]|nr:TD and POZ domain-containing protein 1 [Araneus ventricosus]